MLVVMHAFDTVGVLLLLVVGPARGEWSCPAGVAACCSPRVFLDAVVARHLVGMSKSIFCETQLFVAAVRSSFLPPPASPPAALAQGAACARIVSAHGARRIPRGLLAVDVCDVILHVDCRLANVSVRGAVFFLTVPPTIIVLSAF